MQGGDREERSGMTRELYAGRRQRVEKERVKVKVFDIENGNWNVMRVGEEKKTSWMTNR